MITRNFLEFDDSGAVKYDVVVLRHVLEHLPDPVLAMRKINGLLVPGGRAILEFPNIAAWELTLKRRMKNLGLHRKKYRDGYVPGHCTEFSRKSFGFLAAAAGFEIEVWETYSYHPFTNFLLGCIPAGVKARAR